MTVIDGYLTTLSDTERRLLGHMYAIVRQMVPDVREEIRYGMPSLTYRGEGLVAIMVRGRFISLYPFCSVDRLGIDLGAYKTTKGSIHFTLEQPLPDDLLRELIAARVKLFTA